MDQHETQGMETCPACHRHKHTPRDAESLQQLKNRLSRMTGQLNGIARMLDENRYCGDILIQISAVEKALQGFGYTVALVIMCVIRELLGSGTFGAGVLNGGAGIRIIPEGYPAMHMIMPVGGFLTLGFVVAGFQWLLRRIQNNKKEDAKK
jgi:uncharacterized membrane protein